MLETHQIGEIEELQFAKRKALAANNRNNEKISGVWSKVEIKIANMNRFSRQSLTVNLQETLMTKIYVENNIHFSLEKQQRFQVAKRETT